MTRILSSSSSATAAAAAAVARRRRPPAVLASRTASIVSRSTTTNPRPECGRFFSSASASAATASAASAQTFVPPRIISRRALDHYLPLHPELARPPPPRSTKKPDDSSWPLPMRIAGYVALALTVPYTLATLVASSSALRDALEGDRPDAKDDRKTGKWLVQLVREYWGVGEGWAYVDWLRNERRVALAEWGGGGSSSVLEWAGVGSSSSNGAGDEGDEDNEDNEVEGEGEHTKEAMSFETELPHLSSAIRNAQVEIERLRHSTLLSRIALDPDGDMGACAERALDGGAPADAGALRKIMAEGGVAAAAGGNVPVAIDFVDEETPAGAMEEEEAFDAMKAIDGEGGGEGEPMADGEHPAAAELRRATHNMSAWHYVPDAPTASNSPASSSSNASPSSSSGGGRSSSSSSAASSADPFAQLRLKELEDKATQLALDLKDPNCTRDMDDMRHELRQVKAEARRLRGWGGTIKGWLGR